MALSQKKFLVRPSSYIVSGLLIFGTVCAEPLERSLNEDAFQPLLTEEDVAQSDSTPGRLTFNRTFPVSPKAPPKFDGRVTFVSCREVLAFNQDWIAAGRYFRSFRAMKVRCKAFDEYARSIEAKRSYLPEELSEKVVRKMPALLVPPVSSEDRLRRQNKSLEELHSNLRVKRNGARGLTIETQEGKTNFKLLARGDFDHNGSQDWLVSVHRTFKGGHGNISALFLVQCDGPSEPFTIERLI